MTKGLLSVFGESYFSRAAVTSDLKRCSDIGSDILQRNGSVVDSIIAVTICKGVHYGHAMGIGGGHSLTVYLRDKREAWVVDARETAPQAARSGMYANEQESIRGVRTIAIPGEIAGFGEAHRRFGKLPWKSLFEPTISRVRKYGIEVVNGLAEALRIADNSTDPVERHRYFFDNADMRRMYTNPSTGQLYKRGEVIPYQNTRLLIETLKKIADNGANDFYTGALSQTILSELQRRQSIITAQDLSSYRVRVRRAMNTSITVPGKGTIRIYSNHAPGSGNMLIYMLNIIENLGFNSKSERDNQSLFYHRMAEAMKFAFAQRSRYGDPSYCDMRQAIREMADKNFAKEAANKILKSNRTSNDPRYYGANYSSTFDHGTAHMSAIAPNGDAAALTSTINWFYGSGVTGRSTGILYNDQMADFSFPNFDNSVGMPPAPCNYIRPGARPVSSAIPTIVTDRNGDVIMAIGAAGSTRILSNVAMYIVRMLYLDQSLASSVDVFRMHHQLTPNELLLESNAPESLTRGLQGYGHTVKRVSRASVINLVGNFNGRRFGIFDPRRQGGVSGF